MSINYKKKLEKYIEKNAQIINKIQVGNGNDKKVFLKKLFKIKETMKTKGFVFWFDIDGKIISKSNNTKNAKTQLLEKINKNTENWKNAIVTELVIEFDPDNVMDEELGGVQITVELNKIKYLGENISIQQKNKSNSLFTMRYKYDELNKFKPSDLKKISLFVSNEKLKKINPFKTYHYENMIEYL